MGKLLIALTLLIFGIAQEAQATVPCGCNTIECPSCPTQTPTPTLTPTPTPTINITPTPITSPTPQPTSPPQGGDTPGPFICPDPDPGITFLQSVISQGSGSVLLTWSKNPQATSYSISYGTGSGSYTFGIPSVDPSQTSIVISALNPNQNYCFALRAVKGCMPGPLSNEVCTQPISQTPPQGGAVLGLSTTTTDIFSKTFLLPFANKNLPNIFNINFGSPLTKIIIPSLGLDLPVTGAKIVDGYWETSENSVSHGLGSGNPGQANNIVLFAHNRDGLFGNLYLLQPNQIISLQTKDNWHQYLVEEIKEVAPDNIQVVLPTASETLTLYTCSGINDEKRLVVTAKPL